MIPEPAAALQAMMGTLMMQVAPAIEDEYRKSSVNLLAFAAIVIATEFDRAVQIRVDENRAMREIFAAAASIDSGELRQRLLDAATGQDGDLRVSALTAANNDLRRLLIDLQAAVEELDTPQAKGVEREIWRFLRDAAERRAIQIG